LVGFIVLNTTSFIVGGNKRYHEKTTDLSQVTVKLYHIMLYTSTWAGFWPHNYHMITITTKMAPV